MAYTKTTWRNNQSPAINADNLNHIEQGVYEAHQDIAENTQNIENLTTQTGANTSAIALEKTQRQQADTAETLARENADNLLSARMDTFTQLPSGSTSGDAELIDIRVGADGVTYPTAGDAVRGQVTDLKSDLDAYKNHQILSESGTYSDDDGVTEVAQDNRRRNIEPLPINEFSDIYIQQNYGIWVYCLDENYSLISSLSGWKTDSLKVEDLRSGTKYINFAIKDMTDNHADLRNVVINISYKPQIVENIDVNSMTIEGDSLLKNELTNLGSYTNGWLQSDGSIAADGNSNKATLTYIYTAPRSFFILANSDYSFYFTFFDENNNVIEYTSYVSYRKINKGDRFRICIRKGDGTETYTDITEFTNNVFCLTELQNEVNSILQKVGTSTSARNIVSGLFSENHLIAHKGGNGGEENTITNFEIAYSNGYKMIEFDVQFTSDEIPVLWHDDNFTVQGTTYTIANYTYAELIAVKPNLATLDEGLVFCKTHNMACDIDFTKTSTDAQIEILLEHLTNCGMQGNAMITCWGSVARKILEIDDHVCICVSSVHSVSAVDSLADIAPKPSCFICSIGDTYITQQIIDRMHHYGFKAKAWTVNSVTSIKNYYNMKIEFIITDSVKESDL